MGADGDRSVNVVDVFVHPEQEHFKHPHSYEMYLDRVLDRARMSSFPVLVNGSHLDRFEGIIPEEHTFQSRDTGNHKESGAIADSDWERFAHMLDRADHFLLHGTFYGQCVSTTGLQIFGHVMYGAHWRLSDPSTEENRLVVRAMQRGFFVDAPIDYGIALVNSRGRSVHHFPWNRRVRGFVPERFFPYGDATAQFTSELSELHNAYDGRFVAAANRP